MQGETPRNYWLSGCSAWVGYTEQSLFLRAAGSHDEATSILSTFCSPVQFLESLSSFLHRSEGRPNHIGGTRQILWRIVPDRPNEHPGSLMTPSLRSHTLQSSAALRTGTRVEKINSKHGDSTQTVRTALSVRRSARRSGVAK